MLAIHTCLPGKSSTQPDLSASTFPPDVVWIDLCDPGPEEIAFVERSSGLHVPTLTELSEIESSSRLRAEKGALYLSTPIVFRTPFGEFHTTSVGFVLKSDLLITIRYAEIGAFSAFAEQAAKPAAVHHSSGGAFIGLLEAFVDRMADGLETIGGELDTVSKRLFRTTPPKTAVHLRPAREDADLKEILRRVGGAGDLTAKIRDTLLGFGRMVPYVSTLGADWLSADVQPRFETLRSDIASLNDYDAHLTNNVQLLLDATLGMINIEQNNIIKVLTIVSVVGVPPTLVASMYGMNFKHMPELDWAWGYPYGLLLIALSAIAPLLWFKLRGWL
jgi:magnesium transporter